MAELLRNDDLEDIITCPVCLELFKGKIYSCVNGHDICQTCRPQLESCPVCRDEFKGGRNLGLEQVASLRNKSRPEEEPLLNAYGPKNLNHNLFKGPRQQAGRFPCIFNKVDSKHGTCAEYLPICRLLNHVRSYHKDDLVSGNKFSHAIRFDHEFKCFFVPGNGDTIIGKVIHVPRWGIFYLKIMGSKDDVNCYAWLTMVESKTLARKFQYSLKIFSNYDNEIEHKYSNKPHSIQRKSKEIIENKTCFSYRFKNAPKGQRAFLRVVLNITKKCDLEKCGMNPATSSHNTTTANRQRSDMFQSESDVDGGV